jgi:beta-ureidopropionase / N-carbamoyl-L-amino-acid hydrolase
MSTSVGPRIDASWVISQLRELDRRTGGASGARRVAWTEPWHEARAFLAELLAEIEIELEQDEAGNLWAWLKGDGEPALALGSHLDSVPAGGWLDGALGVMAGLGVLRSWAAREEPPPRTLALVDWADEEGARFGHSLFGSSAFAGTLAADDARRLVDREGRRIEDVLAADGIDLDRALDAGSRRSRLAAYIELHIEQGPVMEHERLRAAAVAGCVGVERHRIAFIGQAAHAGTTPMDMRSDAGLAAAAAALAIEEIAREHGGTATTGALELTPGAVTIVPGRAELSVDLRNSDPDRLAAMLDETREAGQVAADRRGCDIQFEPLWEIAPIAFDPRLVRWAREACAEVTGSDRVLISGALHDAAEVARVLPVAMIFTPSIGGLSHTPVEDTGEDDLTAAIEAFGLIANRLLHEEFT